MKAPALLPLLALLAVPASAGGGEGVTVRLEVSAEPREGADAAIRFRISDPATRTPLAGLNPAAWIDRPAGSLGAQIGTRTGCVDRVEELLGGTLFGRPVVDLNAYTVLALNEDPTISVVDPLFGFGGTKLLAMIYLESPGEDWVLLPDRTRLFVSQPKAGKVAAVDTSDWKVLASLEVGPRPGRLILEPDGATLWIALDGEPTVAALDTASLKAVARVPVGTGAHDMVLSDDGGRLFVTNRDGQSLTVIDTAQRAKITDVPLGSAPTAVAFSRLARAAYAVSGETGRITVVDAGRLAVTATIEAEPGLAALRFSPDGRLGFVPNPQTSRIHILDPSRNRIVQTGALQKAPDQVSFSENLAYVRHRGSEIVLMIPLDQVGQEGRPVPVVDFPGGEKAPGSAGSPSAAPAIVRAPGATAVLVANPADKAIYYYKEGMAAPMGSFQNYGRYPRAVLVVDRSLEESAPGVYETVARLPAPGAYRVAFFLDSPRTVQCFDLAVAADPGLEAKRLAARPVAVQPQIESREVTAGEPARLRFRLTDPNTGAPEAGLTDVAVLTFLASGAWSQRHTARVVGEGLYEVDFVPPGAGSYRVAVECLSRGLPFHRSPQVSLHATEKAAPPSP